MTAWRTTLHGAGAAALSALLQCPPPASDQRQLPCPCGHLAQYQRLRSKPVLTVVGLARVSRPYYLCGQYHEARFPADGELDIVDTEVSPGVRRMLAVVRAAAPFDHGHQQIQVLADLEVTTKAVERAAEAIGGDIAEANVTRSSGPSSWICPSSPASRCASCMCKWMGRECQW